MALIDADILKQRFDEREADDIELYGGVRIVECFPADEAKAIVDEMPTVDATVFPCKVGDPVWFVGTSNTNRLKAGVIETTVEKLVLKSGGIYMKLSCNAMYETSCRSIGKSVFFSREEAEAALAKMKG